MKKTTLSILISSMILTSNISMATESKKLTFYRDLAEYKESSVIEPENGSLKINLIDTAVLDSFNVVLSDKGNDILPSSIEIHEKSEENILKLNVGKKIFVNGESYVLKGNANGFLKLKNKANLITYIPKDKISEISFESDVSSTNHIAKINLRENLNKVNVDHHYMLGMLSWKPSYDFYIKDKNTIQLDYFVEVNNQTLNTFEDIKMEVIVDKMPNLLNREYTSSEQGGVFDYTKKIHLIDDRTKNEVYSRDRYHAEGFERSGYSSKGFDRQNGYAAPIKRYEEGLEVFSLPNNITLSPKSVSKHLYMDTKEIKYEKINEMFEPNIDDQRFYFSHPDKPTYGTHSHLIIPNEENIIYKNGVGALYSKDKSNFNKILLSEYNINNTSKNERLRLNLGKNAGLDVEAISKERLIEEEDLLIYNDPNEMKEIAEGLKTKTLDYEKYASKRLSYPISFSVELSKNEFKAHNRSNEDTLRINEVNSGSISFVFDENKVKEAIKLIDDYKNLSKKDKTKESYDKLTNSLLELKADKERMTFNLQESNDIVFYKMIVKLTHFNLHDFDHDNYNEYLSIHERAELEKELNDYFEKLK